MAIFIKFDGVDGESKDTNHSGWSDLMSFSQDISKSAGGATGQTRRRGTICIGDVVGVKAYDKSSPKLAEGICTGKVYATVTIEDTATYGGDRQTFLKYELTNVSITSLAVSASGSGGEDSVPTECFSLNFEEMQITYTQYASDGTSAGDTPFGWKVEEGEAK
jgi:type VI secretion system secreted protein Hcp